MKKHSKRGKRLLLALTAVILIFCVIFISVMEIRIRPVIREVASSQAENAANNAIESAIVRVLEENKITYLSLVDIEKDDMGRVSTVKADTINMNKLKNTISRAISDEIKGLDSQKISVPLGTVMGVSFLSGKGPRITTEVTLSCNVNLTIENKFNSAGINQTLHEIIVNIDAVIFVIMPRSGTTAQVHTNFCVAQTVIIGTVPQTFADFGKKDEKNE